MITVKQLRKSINKNSSEKAKFYAGMCGFYKMLSNGFGATVVLSKTIRLNNNQIIRNVKINSKNVNIAFVARGKKNIIFENVHIYSAQTAFEVYK